MLLDNFLIPDISMENGCSQKDSSYELEFNDDASEILFLDFGRKTTGYFYINMFGENIDKIKIKYGPVKELIIFEHEIPVPENNVLFVDSDNYIAARYLEVTFCGKKDVKKKLTITKIGLLFSAFPVTNKGMFESNDKVLDDIWKCGAYTVQLCMQKNKYSGSYYELPETNENFLNQWKSKYSTHVIFDGPRRDREVWIGDIRTEALTAYSAFGDTNTTKASLELFLDLQRNDGTVPGSATTWQEFKEYNLWWIISFWECYLYSGDEEFFESQYQGINSLINWILFNLNDSKYIFSENTWMWTFPRSKYGAATQCILYYCLQCISDIFVKKERTEDAQKITTIMQELKENINKNYWDDEAGAYFDNLDIKNYEKVFMQDTNVYALCFGLADDIRSKRVLSYLKENMWNEYGSTTISKAVDSFILTDNAQDNALNNKLKQSPDAEKARESIMWVHNKQIWPFIVGYEVEAHFKKGNPDDALDLIKRCWGNMVYQEPQSFWEMVDAQSGKFPLRAFQEYSEFDSYNSAAHGWSGWITHIISKYLLGVVPTQGGFKKVNINPVLTKELNNINGVVPTPNGDISVNIQQTDDKVTLNINKPKIIEVCANIDNKYLKDRQLILEVKDND